MDAASPVRVGDVLAGKYRVESVLGVGGMGIVVAARHLQLDQRVALKFMRPEVIGNAEAVARFLREARAAVRLTSQHVARILDTGTLQNGAPYIVMEYLDGLDLAHTLAQHGRLSPGEAADIILQACEAIAEAHSLGIIHRDLKPANLFIAAAAGKAKVVKVLDFGISKATASGEQGMTQTSAILGSPAYMSPEQMRSSKGVDARADIWSLGVILYQAVSGRVPFQCDTFTELCLKIMMDPVPPLVPSGDLTPAFVEIIMRCLDKDPDKRFADVGQLARALAPFASPRYRALASHIRGILGGLPTTVAAAQSSAAKRRGKGVFIAAAAVVLLGVGVAAAVLLGGGSGGATVAGDKPATSPVSATPSATPPATPPAAAPTTPPAAVSATRPAEAPATRAAAAPSPATPAPAAPAPAAAPPVAAAPVDAGTPPAPSPSASEAATPDAAVEPPTAVTKTEPAVEPDAAPPPKPVAKRPRHRPAPHRARPTRSNDDNYELTPEEEAKSAPTLKLPARTEPAKPKKP